MTRNSKFHGPSVKTKPIVVTSCGQAVNFGAVKKGAKVAFIDGLWFEAGVAGTVERPEI